MLPLRWYSFWDSAPSEVVLPLRASEDVPHYPLLLQQSQESIAYLFSSWVPASLGTVFSLCCCSSFDSPTMMSALLYLGSAIVHCSLIWNNNNHCNLFSKKYLRLCMSGEQFILWGNVIPATKYKSSLQLWCVYPFLWTVSIFQNTSVIYQTVAHMHMEAATVLLQRTHLHLPLPTLTRVSSLTSSRNSVLANTEDFSHNWPYFPPSPSSLLPSSLSNDTRIPIYIFCPFCFLYSYSFISL